MTIRLSTTMHTAAIAAADAAANGAKNAAFRNSIQSSLGTNPVVKLVRSGSTVASLALVGSLPIASNAFKISAANWANTATSADADIDTGTWVIRVEKSGDATVYLEGDLGKTGSGQPYLLSGDIEDALGVAQGDLYFQCPSLDTTAGAVATVQDVLDDMALGNEGTASGLPAFGFNQPGAPGNVVMGTIPSGNRLPSWALDSVFTEWQTNAYWTAFVMWFVMFEEAGNTATNTRIELRYPRTYFKYLNLGSWTGIDTNNSFGLFRAAKSTITEIPGTLETITNSSGNTEVYFPPNSDFVIHGVTTLQTINPYNLECVYNSVQARLVVRNAALPDDRAQAKYLIHVGGDWYPNVNVRSAQIGLIPSVQLSRLKRITSSWRSFNAASLTTATQNYNASGVAEDGRTGVAAISPLVFSSNPPPLI